MTTLTAQAPMSDAAQAARLQKVKKDIADTRDRAISVKTELTMAARSAEDDAARAKTEYEVESIQELQSKCRTTYDANDAKLTQAEADAAAYAAAVAAAEKIIIDAKAA